MITRVLVVFFAALSTALIATGYVFKVENQLWKRWEERENARLEYWHRKVEDSFRTGQASGAQAAQELMRELKPECFEVAQ